MGNTKQVNGTGCGELSLTSANCSPTSLLGEISNDVLYVQAGVCVEESKQTAGTLNIYNT